jgi:MinD-like ATPase involved in chromosome partitioning or flagellar assembly
MTTIALTSIRGAPGVTTTALLLASVLGGAPVAEADLSGGVIAVRYELGREPGLTTLAAANPRDPEAWRDHAQDAGGVPVLVGPDASEAAESLWRTAGERLAGVIGRIEPWVIVDAGRVHRLTPAVREADIVVVLVRPVAEHLVGLTHAIRPIRREASGELAIVVVGDGPYRAADVQSAFDHPVVAHLPHDPGAAGQLLDGRGGRSTLSRSRLARAVTDLGSELEALVVEREPVVVP